MIKVCQSCGKVLKKTDDNFNQDEKICSGCTDEHGYQKRYSQVIKETRDFLISQLSVSKEEAEKIAKENVAKLPFWAQRQKMMLNKTKIVITDVGSTTTKALLLCKDKNDKFVFSQLQSASTTVEKPTEDVNIGVYNAVRSLEKVSGIQLLSTSADFGHLLFTPETIYLSTSSAGGGLQILVIGLTMFDSASSGKRCAYGAGGVILDTFAIDDKRSSLEQMQAMGILHPDIILMAGGVDGGAVASLLRLGEILQLANPKPKFGEKAEIPLVFAGNKDAQTFVAGLFQKRFDLYLVPNIRPTLEEENLQPAREKIHRLFMENVMEQAPGYGKLKTLVADDIIPTPTGVIRALQLVSEHLAENVMAVDIGGATTDVFSNILGEYFRTVSANYGMSYSISNVLKDAGMEAILNWLPTQIELNYVRNFIANKMLYPTFIARNELQIAIEQAVARAAIAMSKKQHMEMNFKTKQIGFLDKLKNTHDDLEKISEAFYFEKAQEAKKFHMYDINILIGSGGILAHTDNHQQALAVIYDGFRPEGITEIWKDRYFISPHLGKLSAVNEQLASRLLSEDTFDKIGIAIRPIGKKWKGESSVMTIIIAEKKYQIKVGDLLYIPNEDKKERTIQIRMEKGFFLKPEFQHFQFESSLPIFIDAAIQLDFSKENTQLKMFDLPTEITSLPDDFIAFTRQKKIETGRQLHQVELPYEGSILVREGQQVEADTVIGENLFDPPKVYVISLFDKTYLKLTPENIAECLRIKEGEEVKYGQRIVEVGRKSFIEEIQFQHYYFDSPVRGRVEKINLDSGTIIMREIQDYTSKPVTLNVAKMLNMKPKNMMPYIRKALNDFVYAGDLIASKIIDLGDSKHPMLVSAPTTGTIKQIDKEKGTVTIQYDREPYRRTAGVKGIVESIEPGHSAVIACECSTLNGIIGFGTESWGELKFIESAAEIDSAKSDEIVIFPQKIDQEFLQKAANRKVKGVIAASIDNADLVEFIGDEIGVALTGNESIPFPLIITEGFGDFEMFQDYADFFKQNDGKFIYINGHTQIRAGVVRPKMIVME